MKLYQIGKMFKNNLCVKALIFGIHKRLITIIENEEYNYKVICGKKIWIDKYTNVKRIYEKMFNAANPKKNANQNHNEIFHISIKWPLPK